MPIVDVHEYNARFLKNFTLVGPNLDDKQRVIYMTNACTLQIEYLIEDINLQLEIQGGTSDEEMALHLSSFITDAYPGFTPKMHDCIACLLDTCTHFLIETWGYSAVQIGIANGWFEESPEGIINLTPSFSA